MFTKRCLGIGLVLMLSLMLFAASAECVTIDSSTPFSAVMVSTPTWGLQWGYAWSSGTFDSTTTYTFSTVGGTHSISVYFEYAADSGRGEILVDGVKKADVESGYGNVLYTFNVDLGLGSHTVTLKNKGPGTYYYYATRSWLYCDYITVNLTASNPGATLGLTELLAGKANVSHTHAEADVT